MAEDNDYDLVVTKKGYAVIYWENSEGTSGNVVCYPTPESLCERLLAAYREYQEWLTLKQSGDTERNPTEEEEKMLDRMCEKLMAQLQ